MQKTKIEWCDYTWNPIKGICQMGCPYCYARRIYQRFKWDPTPRLDERELMAPYKLKKPSKIFVCSTHEIFGWWVEAEWIRRIFKVMIDLPQHIFQVLTKNPLWFESFLPLPKNIWCGTTVDNNKALERIEYLYVSTSRHKGIVWVSFEPLLERINIREIDDILADFDWIVIGGLTGSKRMNCKTNPEMKEWIDEIVSFARKYNIPVFIKDNAHYPETIREFPDGGEAP